MLKEIKKLLHQYKRHLLEVQIHEDLIKDQDKMHNKQKLVHEVQLKLHKKIQWTLVAKKKKKIKSLKKLYLKTLTFWIIIFQSIGYLNDALSDVILKMLSPLFRKPKTSSIGLLNSNSYFIIVWKDQIREKDFKITSNWHVRWRKNCTDNNIGRRF